GEIIAQTGRDLLRAVVAFQPALDLLPQRQDRRELRRFRPPRLLLGVGLGRRGPIPTRASRAAAPEPCPASQLAADRRRTAPQLAGDLADPALTRLQRHDLLTLGKRQPRARGLATPWHHPASLTKPILRSGHRHASHRCGLGHITTSTHLPPEHLPRRPQNHSITPSSTRCCDDP